MMMPTVARSKKEYIVVLGRSGVDDSSLGLLQPCSCAAVLSLIAIVFVVLQYICRKEVTRRV